MPRSWNYINCGDYYVCGKDSEGAADSIRAYDISIQ